MIEPASEGARPSTPAGPARVAATARASVLSRWSALGADGGARRITLALALIAILTPIAVYGAYASGDAVCYLSDGAQLHVPRYRALHDSLRRGEFPLWQTWVYGGSPYHANPENPTLYPPVLALAWLLPPIAAVNAANLLHLGLAGLGMFLLVRRLWSAAGLRAEHADAGAVVGGMCFALAHWTRRDTIALVGYGHAHALLPWVLWLVEGVLHGPRPRRAAAWLALATAGLAATGGLYVIAYGMLGIVLWSAVAVVAGGRATRRRAGWLALAALLAAGMLLAQLLPYLEWLPRTSRAGRLPIEEARSMTLGGQEGYVQWSQVWSRTIAYTAAGTVLALAACALPLARRRVVLVPFAIAGLGFAAALGGGVWRALYEHVPPFDQIRTAVRAWVLVNACLPLLAAFGFGRLLAWVPALRGQRLAPAAIGAATALALVPFLMRTGRLDAVLLEPESASDLMELYPRWREAARRCGTEWRAADFERTRPDGRNEQFITTLLGVETVHGYLGHVWDPRQAEHLYGPPGMPPLDRAARARRLAVLSVRWILADPLEGLLDPGSPRLHPIRIERTALIENPSARPRGFLPRRVVGLAGPFSAHARYDLLDRQGFPLDRATLVELGDGPPPSDAEIAALDVLVLAVPDVPTAEPWRIRAEALGVVVLVHGSPGTYTTLLDLIAKDEPEPGSALAFERERAGAAVVRGPAAERARYWVASEPWWLDPGWQVEAGGSPAIARRADGAASAVLVPAGADRVEARYRPAAARRGFLLAAPFLAAALLLLALPYRSRAR